MSLENKLLRHFSWDVNETHWSSSSIGIYSMILWSKNLVPWILKGEYIPPVRLLICNKDRPVPFKLNFKSKYQLSSVMSDSLRPYGVQHTRPPCPSPTPEDCSNSCPSHQWCHPTISSCRPLLLPPSIFPSIRVFSKESVLRIRWPKYWNFSFPASVLPMNIQDWFPLGWTGWISL